MIGVFGIASSRDSKVQTFSAPESKTSVVGKATQPKLFNTEVQKADKNFKAASTNYADLLNQYNAAVSEASGYKQQVQTTTSLMKGDKTNLTSSTNPTTSNPTAEKSPFTPQALANIQNNPQVVATNIAKAATQQAVVAQNVFAAAPVLVTAKTDSFKSTTNTAEEPKKSEEAKEDKKAQTTYSEKVSNAETIGKELSTAEGNVYSFQDLFNKAVTSVERKADLA